MIRWISTSALVALFSLGIYVAAKRPPREVANRHTLLLPESYCERTDNKGNCDSWGTRLVMHYYAVSTDGATCDVGMYIYLTMKKGDSLKCWQLFGWSGGASDEELRKSW